MHHCSIGPVIAPSNTMLPPRRGIVREIENRTVRKLSVRSGPVGPRPGTRLRPVS